MNRSARALLAAAVLTVASAGAAVAGEPDDRPSTRIVGGERARTAQAPWAIQLANTGSPSPNDEYCGATLVAANKIVTAAHCGTEAINTYTAIQGRDDLADKSAGRESKIASIWTDPAYGTYPGHDVAVFTLATPFIGVPTLQLESDRATDTAGAVPTVYGWGATEGTGPAETFQKVKVPVLGDARCEEAYAEYGYVANGEICAGYEEGGKDSCQGDSGGPLVLDGRLFGVVSWGVGCADAGNPGVYAEVATYAGALQAQISSLGH